ncbi:hypothetical protein GQ457_06G021670 [Hibiscus cannabinus]
MQCCKACLLKDTAKQAQIEWRMVAKLAKHEARCIIGPIISSGWDFFEAICNDGTIPEGFPRGTGTLLGSYGGGFLGELRLGRVDYPVGSFSFVSWVEDSYESPPDVNSESKSGLHCCNTAFHHKHMTQGTKAKP